MTVTTSISVHAADAIRWVAIAIGCLCLGTILALYRRAWKFATPTWPVRLISLGGAGLVAALMISTYDAMGRHLTWRGPASIIVQICYLAGLVWLLVWFRLPEGRKFRHVMVNEYATRRLMRMAKHVEQVEDETSASGSGPA